jgi:hypothetical protein
MYALCIRYTLDPNWLKHFRDYVEHELEAIRFISATPTNSPVVAV